MTVVAVSTARNVCRVLAGGNYAVMTGTARTQDLGMVDCKYGCKDIGRVAILADVCCLNVSLVLASGVHAVMAVQAIAGDIHMVEIRRQPTCRRVTIVTVNTARDVVRVLAGGRKTVMTGTAGAHDLRVVDRKHGRKDIGRMAVLADVAGLNVSLVLAGRLSAVMAADAVVGDVYMVESCGPPGDRRMAVIAGITARYVRRVLAGCDAAIMTGAADADDLSVINRKRGCKDIGRVAILADIAGLNMRRRIFASSIHAVMAVDAVAGDIQMVEVRRQPASR